MVNAKFQIYKDKAEKYRFRLRAPNNKIVTVGEAYESKAGCLKGVNAVKKYCRSEIEDITIAKMNEPPHLHEEIVLVLDEPPATRSTEANQATSPTATPAPNSNARANLEP